MIIKTQLLKMMLLFVLLAVVLTPTSALAFMAKVTLKVVDEDGKPVNGANVMICLRGGCLKKDAISDLRPFGTIFHRVT